MWRQEDVYFALAGGIDVFTLERASTPEAASEKIDPAQPSGLIMMPIPPLMHGAGQMGVLRSHLRGRRPRSSPTASTPTRCGAPSSASA